jgi:hypothetical protein
MYKGILEQAGLSLYPSILESVYGYSAFVL